MEPNWECIVVGGGAAGLSAALVLGRARRRTLVIDAGKQSNRVAHGIGGLLGHNTRPPAEYYAAARAEVAAHPAVELWSGEVAGGTRTDVGFELDLTDGSRETARRVLLATGMDYRIPDLPGAAELWGRSVFHCPFCHGWENRDRPLGVLNRGGSLLLRAWSEDVTLFTDGSSDLTQEDRDRLDAAGVAVDDRPVVALHATGGELIAVGFDDGSRRDCAGLLVPVTLRQRDGLAQQLGATSAPPGPIAADALAIDAKLSTGVPGLSAAGDVSAQIPSVPAAVAAGQQAAAMLVVDLMTEAPGAARAGSPAR